MQVKQWLLALVTGGGIGFIFAKVGLDAPAPPTVAGILGIVGIAIGFWLGKM